jgi:Putative 2OG-Fe(II) oxygenase
MEGFAYFPAIVYRDERPDLAEKVLPTCIQYLDQVRKPEWPMSQSAHLAHDPVFREVADYLLLSVVDLLRGQGYAVDKYDFYLSGLWAQEINRGGGTNVHVHKNSQMCGWFFLETPQGGAYPIYHDTRMNKSMIELDFVQGEEVTNATNTIHFNNMVPGTVMFGNSWMQHQLTGSNADTPTRCIHFIVSHKERPCSTC